MALVAPGFPRRTFSPGVRAPGVRAPAEPAELAPPESYVGSCDQMRAIPRDPSHAASLRPVQVGPESRPGTARRGWRHGRVQHTVPRVQVLQETAARRRIAFPRCKNRRVARAACSRAPGAGLPGAGVAGCERFVVGRGLPGAGLGVARRERFVVGRGVARRDRFEPPGASVARRPAPVSPGAKQPTVPAPRHPYCAVQPPSSDRIVPVTRPAAREARNTTAAATSAVVPTRPSGMRVSTSARNAGSSRRSAVPGV